MGQSAEELRQDIERTRTELGGTMDAIGDRVSPGRIIERRKNRVVLGVRSARDRVMGTAGDAGGSVAGAASDAAGAVKDLPSTIRQQSQGNPMLAGAVAFGVGLVVAAAIPPSQAERNASSQIKEKAAPLGEKVGEAAKEVAENLKEPAQQAVAEVKDAASAGAERVTESAKDAAPTSASSTSSQDATY